MTRTSSAPVEHGNESSVDLLLKAKSGDDDALERLLGRYLPRLRRWTSRRLPMALRTLLDSGDLVQDAIISAMPHLKALEIRTERALWVYLKQVVRYRIIDLNKRSHRGRPGRNFRKTHL
jgi:RNA polymerase sigma-70 factor, ECF subfamily